MALPACNLFCLVPQDENEDGSRVQCTLQERLGQLQALCLHLEGQQPRLQQERLAGGSAGAADTGEPWAAGTRQAGVLEALTSTLRALRPTNAAQAAEAAAGAAKLPPALAPDKVRRWASLLLHSSCCCASPPACSPHPSLTCVGGPSHWAPLASHQTMVWFQVVSPVAT